MAVAQGAVSVDAAGLPVERPSTSSEALGVTVGAMFNSPLATPAVEVADVDLGAVSGAPPNTATVRLAEMRTGPS